MRVVKVSSLRQLTSVVKRDAKRLERKLDKARNHAARKTVPYVRAHVPVAHSDLRDSLEVDGSRVLATAPHAAAVERGSRPHFPPLEPLIAWVKLRMAQGLLSDRQIAKLPGVTTAHHALGVNAASADFVIARNRRGNATALAIDAPRRIAYAIALAISKHGTKPSWFMRSSVPFARLMLAEECEKALASMGSEA